jgi:hypothetical protein
MIFKQAQEIIDGRKTQTRRLVKPGEYEVYKPEAAVIAVCAVNDRLKWVVERSYAVQPKRGARGLLIAPDGRVVFDAQAEIKGINAQSGVIIDAEQQHRGAAQWLIDFADYRPLRIEITALWREHVQDMTLADCEAEGIASYTFARGVLSETPPDPRWKYIELWDSINTRKGTRWSDNPEVWVIEFKVVTP